MSPESLSAKMDVRLAISTETNGTEEEELKEIEEDDDDLFSVFFARQDAESVVNSGIGSSALDDEIKDMPV